MSKNWGTLKDAPIRVGIIPDGLSEGQAAVEIYIAAIDDLVIRMTLQDGETIAEAIIDCIREYEQKVMEAKTS